jgi:hypothetical protein
MADAVTGILCEVSTAVQTSTEQNVLGADAQEIFGRTAVNDPIELKAKNSLSSLPEAIQFRFCGMVEWSPCGHDAVLPLVS